MKYISKTKTWIALIITLFVAFNTLSIHDLYAVVSSNPYENDQLQIREIEKLYHVRVNTLFNKKISLLLEGENGSGTSKIPEGDNCEENNISTFCVAITAAKEFEQYETALLKRKEYLVPTEDTYASLSGATTEFIAQSSEITTELETARKALDTALQAYNELRIAYPMHQQYQETIKALTEYNKHLSKLRQEVEVLPKKFIDATTAQCT